MLQPQISNHGKPLVYFSDKRENVLVYLSNAVEKFCRETGFAHSGRYTKWGSYGFEPSGILRLEEYYPNAAEDTYKGVSGYIYRTDNGRNMQANIEIQNAYTSAECVAVQGCEFVADAYEEIIKAAERGLIILRRYEDMSEAQLDWISRTMQAEYDSADSTDEYKYFIKSKFPFLRL